MKIALWDVNLSRSVEDIKDWATLVSEKAATARGQGADILLMPEYAAEQWLNFGPDMEVPDQPAWLSKHVPEALGLLPAIAKENDLLLVSGSFPVERPDLSPPLSNRAHILFPDGRMLFQDKMCLTPSEQSATIWNLSPGNVVRIFEWRGYRMAVIICLDIELPALAAKLAKEQIDLLLVPSMTKRKAGYHRVHACAQARAVELQAAVAVTGVIGHGDGRGTNIAGCALYIPCEEAFGHTGVVFKAQPVREDGGDGAFAVLEAPLQEIRHMREGQAEVWPGAWTADHIIVEKV